MSSSALAEIEFPEKTECSGHVLETPFAFIDGIGKCGDHWHVNGPGSVTDREGIHWTRGCNGILAMSEGFAGLVMAIDLVVGGCDRWRRHVG